MSARYYIDQADAPSPGSTASYSIINWAKGRPYPGCVAIHTIEEACGSDYSGGSHTRSNYDVITNDPELAPHVVTLYGSHGSYGVAYIGDLEDQPEALRDAISALADYPILDDDAHSHHELDLENAAWADYGASDFRRALTDYLDENDDAWLHDADRLTDDELAMLWHDGCDVFNVNGGGGCVIEEGESVHFYIKEWFQYNAYTPHDMAKLGQRSWRPSLTWDQVVARTRNEVVPDRDEELDTVCSIIVTQLGDLLVELCGYTPSDALTRGTIQFSMDSANHACDVCGHTDAGHTCCPGGES